MRLLTHFMRIGRVPFALSCAALATACGGPQSALDTAGRDAEQTATLFWWMAGGALAVWVAVLALGVYCVRSIPRKHPKDAPPPDRRLGPLLIIGGGAAIPTVVLAALLSYGLALLPDLVASAPAGSLRIDVSGQQWWWRVRYYGPSGESIDLANEIRLPVGEPVDVRLASDNVIHSFWIPALAGKVDMLPGRVTQLSLEPTRTGVFRGACAEYCGAAHAWMSFSVVVLEKDAFARWLSDQAAAARAPSDPLAIGGQQAFLANGCGACHAVRGTAARGTIGPDLTHVGSRLNLGAGALRNEPDDLLRWIARPDRVKPEAHMPAFGMLAPGELRAIAAYVRGLQ